MKIWCLSPKQQAEFLDPTVSLETVHCPINPGHQRAGHRTSPLILSEYPASVDDFNWTNMSELIITPEVLDALNRGEIHGFSTSKVHIKNASGGLALYELRVTGWGGYARAESGVKVLQSCSACSLSVYSCFSRPGLLFDESQWDKSDIFLIWPMPRYIFVTDRVRQLILDYGLTGAALIPPSDLRCTGTLNPGRLVDWFSRFGTGIESRVN